MSMPIDTFAPARRWQPERDHWGRPLVTPPGGGRAVAYTRTTTVAKTLDDEGALTKWGMRMTAAGLVRRPDLLALIASKLTPGGDIPEEATGEINEWCDQAKEAAASSKAANLGTALHAMTETVDDGGALGHVPGDLLADIDAYRRETAPIEMLAIENFVVLDDWKVAGTFDRLVRMPDGRVLCADLKTGKDLSYSWRSISVQLAIYVHGLLYDGKARQALPPEIDQTTALVVHLPVGGASCTLHELDIAAGWQAFEHSMWTRAWRNRRDLARPIRLAGATKSTGAAASAPKPSPPTASAPATAPADPVRRQWLAERLAALPAEARTTMAAHWPAGVPGMKGDHRHTDAEIDAVVAVLDRVEAGHDVPFGAPDPTLPAPAPRPAQAPAPRPAEVATVAPPAVELDEGADLTPDDIAAIRNAVEALDDAHRLRIMAWHREAYDAGRGFALKQRPSARRFELIRVCIAASIHMVDDELVRPALAAVTGSDQPLHPSTPLGAVIGALTIAEAQRLVDIAERFAAGDLAATVDEAGIVRFAVAA